MENLVPVIIFVGIIWQGFKLMKRQDALHEEMERLRREEDDRNIDFSGHTGSGISYKRKHYPDLEITDDHKTGIVNPDPEKLA